MVLHHVAHGAGTVVVGAASLDADRFGDGDLHVVDVRAVPHRLEHRVGETKRQQVLHRLLAEIVVDAEDVILAEHRADGVVDRVGARAVLAERLLDDDARAHRHQSRRAEFLGDWPEQFGAGGEVERANAFVRAQALLQLGPAGLARHVDRDIVEAPEEAFEGGLVAEVVRAEFFERRLHRRLKVLARQIRDARRR